MPHKTKSAKKSTPDRIFLPKVNSDIGLVGNNGIDSFFTYLKKSSNSSEFKNKYTLLLQEKYKNYEEF